MERLYFICENSNNNHILFSYSVMLRCWETKPEERPSFSSLKKIMKEMERKHEVRSFILIAKYVLVTA